MKDWRIFNQTARSDPKDLCHKEVALYFSTEQVVHGRGNVLPFLQSKFADQQLHFFPHFKDISSVGWGYEFGEFQVLSPTNEVMCKSQYSVVWMLHKQEDRLTILSLVLNIKSEEINDLHYKKRA